MRGYEFTVVIEKDEGGRFVGICPALQGCYTEGETEEEARQLIEDAIRLHVKAESPEMSRFTRKWGPTRCGSRCDLKASLVQFPPGNFHPEEAWLCPGPPVGKPCYLHSSRRAQDDGPDPRQT